MKLNLTYEVQDQTTLRSLYTGQISLTFYLVPEGLSCNMYMDLIATDQENQVHPTTKICLFLHNPRILLVSHLKLTETFEYLFSIKQVGNSIKHYRS